MLSQGEEGDQGPVGEVGAQGPPVKYFLLNSVYYFLLQTHWLYYVAYYLFLLIARDIIKAPHTFLFILPYWFKVRVDLFVKKKNTNKQKLNQPKTLLHVLFLKVFHVICFVMFGLCK